MSKKLMTHPTKMPQAVFKRLRILKGRLHKERVTSLSRECKKVMKSTHWQTILTKMNLVSRDEDGAWRWNGTPLSKELAIKVVDVQRAYMAHKKDRLRNSSEKSLSLAPQGKSASKSAIGPEGVSQGAAMFIGFLKRSETDMLNIKAALFDIQMDMRILREEHSPA